MHTSFLLIIVYFFVSIGISQKILKIHIGEFFFLSLNNEYGKYSMLYVSKHLIFGMVKEICEETKPGIFFALCTKIICFSIHSLRGKISKV